MNRAKLLGDMNSFTLLAKQLENCPQVTRHDKADEKQAWTLAHSFSDLEDSFRRILDVHLPLLLKEDSTPTEIYNTLLDVGEDFRHILYHIKDPDFYNYLRDL